MLPQSMSEEFLDYEQLEAYLRALAFSTRLELIHKLRVPRAASEIRLVPGLVRTGENPDRAISRQAVDMHLQKLEEIGVVRSREADGRRGRVYQVNSMKLYQIVEQFRTLSVQTLGPGAAADATVGVEEPEPEPFAPGPKLVLVHGLLEGKSFALRRSDLRGERGWIIGRKPDLQVALDYDPFVSLENSEILPVAGGFELLDLRASRNGTRLNWRPLPPDQRARLRSGDVVGVGRSLLVFRDD